MELYNSKYVYFDWNDKLKGKKVILAHTIKNIKEFVDSGDKDRFFIVQKGDNLPFSNGLVECEFCYYDPYYEFRKAYLEGKQLQFKNCMGDWEDVDDEPLFTKDEYRIKPEWYVVLGNYKLFYTNSKEGKCVVFEGTEDECIKWIEEHKKFESIMIAWKQGKTIQFKDDDKWEDWVLNEIPSESALETWKEWRIKEEGYVPFDTVQELIDAWDNKYPQNKNRPEGTMPLIWIKQKQKNRVYLITDFMFEKYYKDDVGTEDSNLELKELFDDYTFTDGTVIGKVK